MATLAEVNKTLIEVSDNTEKTSEGISAFVSYIDEQRRKTLEAEREAKAEKAKAEAAASKASAGGGGKSASAGGGFFDKLSTPGKLLAGGGLLGLGSMLGRSLLKRLPGAMLIGFADTIAEALIGDKFDENTKDTINKWFRDFYNNIFPENQLEKDDDELVMYVPNKEEAKLVVPVPQLLEESIAISNEEIILRGGKKRRQRKTKKRRQRKTKKRRPTKKKKTNKKRRVGKSSRTR